MTISWVRSGRVWRFGDAVSVEAISPLRYMLAPRGRGRACLKSVDPDFAAADKDGDLILAGRMFGHGPGHDHAILAIKEAGVAGVLATSFAPQFFRHAVGHGLLVARCPHELASSFTGPDLEVDFDRGNARDPVSGASWDVEVPAGPAQDIVAAGGLVPFLRGRLKEAR
jgi:3-isopropylmalate/(R)-2-methylmalate dehydratase small subunit